MDTISIPIYESGYGCRYDDAENTHREYTLFDNFRAKVFTELGMMRRRNDPLPPYVVAGEERLYMPSRTWHQVNYRRGGDVYGAMNDSIMLRRHVRYVSRHITHDAYWFHASDMDTDDLATSLEKNRNKRTGQGNLHVGTIEAALYRRHPTLHCTARPYIHVFRIDPDALISPWWLHDDGTPEATCREKIYRYVNAYEGCGSVSLVGNLNLFKMVDTIKLPPGNEKDRLWELPRSAQRKIRAYM